MVRIAVCACLSLVGVAQDHFSRAAWRISNDLAPPFNLKNARRDLWPLTTAAPRLD
jgi:hypothetical protein